MPTSDNCDNNNNIYIYNKLNKVFFLYIYIYIYNNILYQYIAEYNYSLYNIVYLCM